MSLFHESGAIETISPKLYKEHFPYDEFPRNTITDRAYPYDLPEEIWITDTTFRDGQQSMESFTLEQIERVFTYLHELDNGNGIIRQTEFFVYTERDREAIRRCQALGYEFPQITTWIRPVKQDMELVRELGIKETGTLMSCSDYHIFGKFNKTRKQVFEMYVKAIEELLSYGIKPRCHLEDITRADLFDFVIPLVKTINEIGLKAGVEIKFRLCDTLGVAKPFSRFELPRSVPGIVYHLKKECNLKSEQLEWHGHNDYHYAVANSTAAWLHGASSISTTLLGIGERTGNTALEAVLVEYCQFRKPKNPVNFDLLNDISRFFAKEFNYHIHEKTPFMGTDFNATKAGIHADGLLKNEDIYNSVDTLHIFNRPIKIAINQFSGNAGIAGWINGEYGLRVDEKVTKKDPVVMEIKQWIDDAYANGRTTAISDCEMHHLVDQYMTKIKNEKIFIPMGCRDGIQYN